MMFNFSKSSLNASRKTLGNFLRGPSERQQAEEERPQEQSPSSVEDTQEDSVEGALEVTQQEKGFGNREERNRLPKRKRKKQKKRRN